MTAAPSWEHDLITFTQGIHDVLEGSFDAVMAAVEANDLPEIHRRWCIAEAQLLAHLEAEERFVLPAFGRTDRREALELLREHGRIRELVLELGIAVELQYIRVEQLHPFAEMLRVHAEREALLLDRWGSQQPLDGELIETVKRYFDSAGKLTR